VALDGIGIEAPLEGTMIVIRNNDQPGVIGEIGTILGRHGVNIANFQLGREKEGGDAIALLYVDGPVSETVLDKLRANPAIRQVKPLTFNVD
ncbi:MAG: ACT domain-containing protein, partial [Rhizobium oryzihabitans]